MRDAPSHASDSVDHEWPESLDPSGSHLSESGFAARFRRAHEPVELGRLGPYELLAELGHGAQGTVFRARQPGTKRDVVLKRLAAGDRAPRCRTCLTPSGRMIRCRRAERVGHSGLRWTRSC